MTIYIINEGLFLPECIEEDTTSYSNVSEFEQALDKKYNHGWHYSYNEAKKQIEELNSIRAYMRYQQ